MVWFIFVVLLILVGATAWLIDQQAKVHPRYHIGWDHNSIPSAIVTTRTMWTKQKGGERIGPIEIVSVGYVHPDHIEYRRNDITFNYEPFKYHPRKES